MAAFAWVKRPAVLKAARIAGYVTFGLVAFLVSVVLTFPTGRLRSYVEGQLTARGYVTHIESLSLRGLGSVSLFGVSVDLPEPPAPPRTDLADPAGGAGAATESPVKRHLDFDRVDLSIGLFRLLMGEVSVTAKVTDDNGVLGPVHVVKGKERITVDVTAIEDFPVPAELPVFGTHVSGRVSGKGQLTYDLKDGLAASTGRLELTIENAKVMKPTLKSEAQGTVSLTDVDLGQITLEVNLDKRSNLAAFKSERRGPGQEGTVIQFDKAEVDGPDAKVLIENHSTIRLFNGKGLPDSQVSVEMAFSLSDSFFERSVTLGGEAQTPNRFLRTLLNMSPQWKSSMAGNYWGVMCSGTLGHPSCLPKKPSIRGGDFKAPAKDEDKGTKPGGAKDSAKPSDPARSAPSAAPTPVPASAPPPPPAPVRAIPPAPSDEQPAAVTAPLVNPSMMNVPRPMMPTVIGRPKAVIRAMEGADDGAEPPPGASPPTEGGVVQPPGGEE